MDDWKIVSSSSGYNKDGIPCGEYLCRNEQDVKECSELIFQKDLVIKDYENKPS